MSDVSLAQNAGIREAKVAAMTPGVLDHLANAGIEEFGDGHWRALERDLVLDQEGEGSFASTAMADEEADRLLTLDRSDRFDVL